MSTLAFNPLPLPLADNLVNGKDRKRYPDPDDVDPDEYKMTSLWMQAFIHNQTAISAAPARLNSVEKRDQGASISATDMSGGSLAQGFYRVTWYATIRVAGDAASSLIVTIDFTDRGQSKSFSSPSIAGSSTGTFAQGGGLVRADKVSPIRYSTTYAAGAGTPMKYDLVLVLERVGP
jgi:hypothetical protein